MARVVVKRQIEAGVRKPIQDSLILPAHIVEQLLDDEAEKFLAEQQSRKRG